MACKKQVHGHRQSLTDAKGITLAKRYKAVTDWLNSRSHLGFKSIQPRLLVLSQSRSNFDY
jgi:hypothetical protein